MSFKLVNGRGYGLVRAMEDDQVQLDDGSTVEGTTLYLYDVIGYDWWTGGGITSEQVISDLESVSDAAAIDVRINSPGGDVFEGIAIYNALIRHGARVTVYIDGLAASIASLIAIAGDDVRMAENAMFMVHRPWTVAMGDGEEFRHIAERLDKVWTAMLATYETRTGLRGAAIEQRVVDGGGEWWFTADEAIDNGFADEKESATKAQVFGVSGYRHVPERVAAKAKEEAPAPRRQPPRVAELVTPPHAVAPRGPDPAAARRLREVELLELMTR